MFVLSCSRRSKVVSSFHDRSANYIANVQDWKILPWMHVFAMQTLLNSVITFSNSRERGYPHSQSIVHREIPTWAGGQKLQDETWGSALLICHATRDLDGVKSYSAWRHVACRYTGPYGQKVCAKQGSLWPECIQYACAEWVRYSLKRVFVFMHSPPKHSECVGFEVLTAAVMNNAIFRDTVPCSQCVNRCFGGSCLQLSS
jgi:hypothetical protein